MGAPVNPQAFQFRDQFYSLVPPWLQTGNAERYMYTLELCRDLLCEKAYQAMTIRLPGVGDYSNLPYLAFDRNLVQGLAESNAAFAGRLQGAGAAWGESGAAAAVIEQLQAYLQNLQPGVPATYPMITIVGNNAGYSTWNQVYQGTPIGAPPTLSNISPPNFDWDGLSRPWRNWLVLPMALVAVPGLSGSSAATSTAAPSECFASPGQMGTGVYAGVWVPATSGTPVNSPWLTLTGLSGLTQDQVGQWITLTGSTNPGNVGCFQIVQVLSASSCVIANPEGVPSDAGPLTWEVRAYPLLAPGPAWGSPGFIFGQGELSAPPVDTGSNIGGVWQPSPGGASVSSPRFAWGLTSASSLAPAYNIIESIRGIAKTWKSAGTYYRYIVIAFDCGAGAPGSAYSPSSAPGSGNPDGTFGPHGKIVGGVWVPTRTIPGNPLTPYLWDAYCQGTGNFNNCSIENIT